ncbi:elongation factor G, partial [Clostridium perfringens]
QADRYGVPRIAYVNKMDIIGADYLNVVKDMRERLQANAVAIQLPIGAENDFIGIIDVIEEKAFMYKDDLGQNIEETEIPAEFKDQVEELRNELVEKVAELDEDLTMKYLEGEEITIAELKAALRKGVVEVKIFPVICGSSYRNKGVQLML